MGAEKVGSELRSENKLEQRCGSCGISTLLAPMWDYYGCHILPWCVDMVVCGKN